MNKDLQELIEQLSSALGDVIDESEKVRSILVKIERSGFDASLTMAVLLGLKGKDTELRKVVYGSGEKQENLKHAVRRISAFDRRFLRALKIQLPD